ncbi:MAG TPA: hypothetical protein VNT26_03490, partial [Candidatus Sulfotelmatobacter sp.]|nr:hypothetical protein [Candidatus Sulfotelmatobacter sp.]
MSSAVWRKLDEIYPGSYLLPMAFAEGCPLNPAYGQGHATVTAACVTILKAWSDGSVRIVDLFQPVQADEDGSSLVPYKGADADQMTVKGELNKLASNIAQSRCMAGVHWRSDATESYKLGEEVAISVLRDQKKTYNE